jgi:peptide-methionine (S)-S-oxide reductase
MRLLLGKSKNKPVVVAIIFLMTFQIAFSMNEKLEKTTLGGGCFWCTEAIFMQMRGVVSVFPGYSGGHLKNPSYREVCTGLTGHAEVVQITFDPSVVSFQEILEVFFAVHDPTTFNRQGADVGTQYRSVIFYHSEEQKKVAETTILRLMNEKVFDRPVLTELTPFTCFFPAEEYHRDYYSRNSKQPYCRMVIAPKVEKFMKQFKEEVKQ